MFAMGEGLVVFFLKARVGFVSMGLSFLIVWFCTGFDGVGLLLISVSTNFFSLDSTGCSSSSSLLSDHESSDLYPLSISPSTFSIIIFYGSVSYFSYLLIYTTTSITYNLTSVLVLGDEFAKFLVEFGVYFSCILDLVYESLDLFDLAVAEKVQEFEFQIERRLGYHRAVSLGYFLLEFVFIIFYTLKLINN